MSRPVRSLYVASRPAHAARWRSLRAAGWPITSTWIDAREVTDADYPALWARCVHEAGAADVLLLYVEQGEILRGPLVEMGAALAAGRPVLWAGPLVGSAHRHPLVRAVGSIDEAAVLLGLRAGGGR